MKYIEEISNKYTRRIGLLYRSILFVEDFIEDAECENVYVEPLNETLLINPVNCAGEVDNSVNHYSSIYELNVRISPVNRSFKELYMDIVKLYAEGLRPVIRSKLSLTIENRLEYFMGVTPKGVGFLLEGDVEKVRIPWVNTVLTVHTHPEEHPFPSLTDLETMVGSFTSRGIAHGIEAYTAGLIIYRVKPITLEELLFIKNIKKKNPFSYLNELGKVDSIRIAYL
ncbi:hypothetical protein IMZ38_04845 [Thermosphaera chiliense]|uniref:JAB domain-containing protein n=1 Tax=Thermosphaera chiliense TaxID=3402707 RepID=A0A7M1UT87_9CREN|nr:hypothetical protein [Thermosphaera aggregans]QOR93974.1 hypothetical protein IMZ38_04845 [Thermosphaera aggregans]